MIFHPSFFFFFSSWVYTKVSELVARSILFGKGPVITVSLSFILFLAPVTDSSQEERLCLGLIMAKKNKKSWELPPLGGGAAGSEIWVIRFSSRRVFSPFPFQYFHCFSHPFPQCAMHSPLHQKVCNEKAFFTTLTATMSPTTTEGRQGVGCILVKFKRRHEAKEGPHEI